MALSKFTTTSSLLVLSFFMGATANACQSTATAETTKTLTRVVQKDGQDDIEIRIENGTLTAKINGETIDASRVRKTDAGYDILAVDGSVMKSIAMQATPDATAGEYKVVIMRQDGANADIDENNEEVDVEVDLVAAPAPVMIGVQLGEVDEALCVHLAVDAAKSTILTGLKEGLPAAKSGLHRFDVVIGVGEGTDGSATAIREALATMKAGETVQLKVRRGAETLTIGVEVVATDLAAMAMPEEFEFEIEMDGEDGEDGADGGTQVIMVGPDGKPMRMQMPQGMQQPQGMQMPQGGMAFAIDGNAELKEAIAAIMSQVEDGDQRDAMIRAMREQFLTAFDPHAQPNMQPNMQRQRAPQPGARQPNNQAPRQDRELMERIARLEAAVERLTDALEKKGS